MNAIPFEGREEDWDRYGDDETEGELPGRPRRQFFNRWSALLFAVILGAVGFYVGVRVEKGQLASTSTASPFAALAGAAGRTGAAGTSTTGTSGASSFASRFGGDAGGFAGFGGASGATIGTISSVNGNTLYITETSGNTVKVTLSSATKITKSEGVSKSKLYPGDSVVIAGVKGSGGTVSATTVTDSGTRASTSSSTTSSSTSGSSAVSSLFGSGG